MRWPGSFRARPPQRALRGYYGWTIETVNSMVKRRLGSALRARSYHTQCREILLRAITHNVMIVRIRVFYRARTKSFSRPTSDSSQRAPGVRLRRPAFDVYEDPDDEPCVSISQ